MILDLIELKNVDLSDEDRRYADFQEVFGGDSRAATNVLAHIMNACGYGSYKIPEHLTNTARDALMGRQAIGDFIIDVLATKPPAPQPFIEPPKDD